MLNSIITGGASLGTIADVSVNLRTIGLVNMNGGLTGGLALNGTRDVFISDMRIENWANAANTIFFSFTGNIPQIQISNLFISANSNERVFYFDPILPSDISLSITNSSLNGDGSAFYSEGTGNVSSVSNATTSAAVTSVSDVAGSAQFNGVGFAVQNFQTVVLSGFTNYTNGIAYIVQNATATSFLLGDYYSLALVPFNGNDTGNYTANAVQISTPSSTASIINGSHVQIANTINYDGGYRIFSLVANTSFRVSATYVANETPSIATWTNGSISSAINRLHASANLNIPNSSPFVSITAQSTSMDDTIITIINTFVNLNLQVAAVPVTIELLPTNRFSLVNATTGEVRYTGSQNTNALLSVTLSVRAVAAGATFAFRILVNGSPANTIQTETSISNTSTTNTTIISPLALATNQLIRIQTANITGTQDIQIRRFTMVIH